MIWSSHMITTLLCKTFNLTVSFRLSRCITLVSIYNFLVVRSIVCRQYKSPYYIWSSSQRYGSIFLTCAVVVPQGPRRYVYQTSSVLQRVSSAGMIQSYRLLSTGNLSISIGSRLWYYNGSNWDISRSIGSAYLCRFCSTARVAWPFCSM